MISGNQLPKENAEYADKAVHFILYGILAFLLVIGFKKQYSYYALRCNAIKWVAILSISYGVIMELLQLVHHQGRHFEIQDIIANSLGVLFGIISFKVIYHEY